MGEDETARVGRTFEAFRKAVQERDYEGVARCLADETFASCINDPIFDFDGPAIVWASNKGDVRVLEMLIEHGADVNAKSKWWAGASAFSTEGIDRRPNS